MKSRFGRDRTPTSPGGSELSPPKNNSSSKDKDRNSGGGGATGREAVAFQDARNEVSGGGALVMSRQQRACSGKNNTETSGGHNSKINNDIDDDDFDALDMTLRSSDLSSCFLDPADMSTTAADNLDDDGENQQKRNRLLLQQNSIEFLSVERARTRPRDGVPPILSKKTLRRQSDSTLFSSIAANGSRVMLDTSLALEDLEKEIRDLKAKEALLHSISATKDHHKTESSTCDLPRKGRLAAPPRREAKILLVSSSALPTQFYDSSKTRNVLRTYLTNTGLEFDEMIEYGFPSEAFMNDDDLDDNNDDDLGPENSHQQQKASVAELAPSCRFLTLRITLTPWHARADESTLYGPRATMGRQLQFKAMVNRFFSRSGNTTTTDVIAAPLSSLSPFSAPVGEPASPEMNPQRSVDTLPTSVSLSALDAAGGDSVTPISSSRPPSRAATGGLRTPSGSRANSRASSPRRDRSSPSSHRASPAATEHCGSNVITPLLPSHILSPNYVSSRATPTTSTTTTTGGEHSSARIGRRLFSPTPSSSSSYSMIPLPIGTGSSSQPPRKGSLSALSLPLGSQQPQTPTSASSSLATHAPIVPPRRKGSTPALFFTPPPPTPSNHGLRSANSTGGREVYPSPSSRAAAQTHGASPPPRRPSDQSDTISASLAFARSVNTSGTGGQYSRYLDSTLDGRPLREKVDTELRAHGLDNIYRNNNTTSRQPVPLVSATVEKSIHPLQTVPHQLPIRQGTKLFHFSNRRDGSGKGGCEESRIGVLASSAVGSSGLLAAAEQTPQSAAPPRIQAKNQRRPGGGCASTTASRNRPAGSTDRAHRRHNYINIKRREEDEMDEYVVHVGDISFVDGLEDLEDDEEQQRREREEVAAVGIEGCWRPIACHQTSTMKTFAFP
ncbi:hypothetical protein BGZ97_011417 [Linnemannia gamsii]|uniref:Uncharacterized protein n=1 Tax=Linnemannia gamsii TaxID=64522 RepID=A0A9P6R7Y8_9FUNG|nr:hypothetical protein BGZ97_011417 [Linnemannia gamsii]